MARAVKVKGKSYKGVNWIRSNKSPGSRKNGWERIRKMLKDALPVYVMAADGSPVRVPRERPGLFAFNTCTMFMDLFPILPRDEKDPDDVDSDAEDHIGDEVRYKVLSVLERSKSGKTIGTT